MMSLQHPLSPTFEGHAASEMDALILFEACLSGWLNYSPRRIHDCERNDLIRSGNVFIYEMQASGIKSWEDGIFWASDLVPDKEGFLIYYELEASYILENNARTAKEVQKEHQRNLTHTNSHPNNATSFLSVMVPSDSTAEVSLIESLIPTFYIKPHGLLKKTCIVSFQGVPHHLVSYYSIDDITDGRLITPTRHPNLQAVIPRSGLTIHKPSSLPSNCANGPSATVFAHPGSAMTPRLMSPQGYAALSNISS